MAFLSYAHFNDDLDDGYLTEFKGRLALEVQAQTGEPFPIFQDRADLFWGEVGQAQIERQIQSVTFLLPVLTPSFFRSTYCRKEIQAFLDHEQRLGRTDLILPLYYIQCREIEDETARASDPLVQVLANRQYHDWRRLRHRSLNTTTARDRLTDLARQIEIALYRSAATIQVLPEQDPALHELTATLESSNLTDTSLFVKGMPAPTRPDALWSSRLEGTRIGQNDRPADGARVAQHVLILTENNVLGYQCEAVLRAEGFECSRTTVDERFSPEALIDIIIREGQEIVLCEYRMSSYYSALALLRDLNAASLSSRVRVIALVLDDRDLDEFFFLGGATYGVLKPGGRDVRAVIVESLQRLERRRNSVGRSYADVVSYLSSLQDERVFRQFAIELFNHLEYREVRAVHGPMEYGKDLVFYEQNRLGELEYVGVQVRIGDLHDNVNRKGNVSSLMLQTAEAFNSKVIFGGVGHYLDKYLILVSGTITAQAHTRIDDFLRHNRYSRRVYVWGREKIADVKVHFAPALLHFPR